MKATIEIDCDTAGQLVEHLNVIIETVKIRSRGTRNNCRQKIGFPLRSRVHCSPHEVTITSEP